MDQQRNLIIAIALSIADPARLPVFLRAAAQARTRAVRAQTQTAAAERRPAHGAEAATAPPPAPAAAAEPREAVFAGAPRVAIDTPSLKGSIALAGGRLDDLTLRNYHETIDPSSPPIVLLSPDGTEHPYFVEYWLGRGGRCRRQVPGRDDALDRVARAR